MRPRTHHNSSPTHLPKQEARLMLIPGRACFANMSQLLKTTWLPLTIFVMTSVVLVDSGPTAFAETLPASNAWAYLLINGSYLLDDCPACDRFIAPQTMYGTFTLRFLESNPLVSR